MTPTGLFIGATTVDLIHYIQSYPIENEKINAAHMATYLGGPATNAAITFAALGGKSTLVSAFGQNAWTSFLRERLSIHKVDHMDLIGDQSFQPMVSSVLVNLNNGDRTVIASPSSGAEEGMTLGKLELNKYDVVCLDGFYGKMVSEILHAQEFRTPVVLDGGSFKPYTKLILPKVDYPVLSERFALPGEQALEDYFEQLGKSFAVTHGEKPIALFESGRWTKVPVPQVKSVDTLGAGDIFHGAFCWYLSRDVGGMKEVLSDSAAVAALSCQYEGPREWIRHI